MTPEALDLFMNGVPAPLMLVDDQARLSAINDAAAEVFGASGLGRHYASQMRQPAVARLVELGLGGMGGGRAEFRLLQGGRERNFSVQATVISGQVLLAFEDLSLTEEADQIRRDFVANVSHELKTPLTALIGFIETLRGAARDDASARDRFLAVMEREAGRMSRLITDLLSLSRVESLARQSPRELVDMAILVRASAAALKPMVEGAGVELRLDVPEGPCMVLGDADQLTQVVNNLAENAIKYGASGEGVEMTLRGENHLSWVSGPGLRLDIVDHGEGFDPVHIPRLTERFYRVDDHRSREKGGTGLGLAIAKHIIQRHKGRLVIQSEPEKGSTFSVLLPLHQGGAGG
ncbi:two-component sensor histidine kinase [Alphaproteobacteria bacterium KMM 3653]|uniref:histidine kinase n=1 Tax=Harenicola maris TaxID=2841044 RepID=A0AAP2CM13_9RHOB|nr:two-component sensor histidine kinase [Harenicola maris]